jgi:translation initiation factor IF-2
MLKVVGSYKATVTNLSVTAPSVCPSKVLTLKRVVEQGVVRQSFSHGRSKAVVVEKVRRISQDGAPGIRDEAKNSTKPLGWAAATPKKKSKRIKKRRRFSRPSFANLTPTGRRFGITGQRCKKRYGASAAKQPKTAPPTPQAPSAATDGAEPVRVAPVSGSRGTYRNAAEGRG